MQTPDSWNLDWYGDWGQVTVEELVVPWAERYSRVTSLMTGFFVIKLLQACPSTQGECNLTRLSCSRVNAIMLSAVQRGMLRRTEEEISYLGIEQRSSQKGTQLGHPAERH